MKKWCVLSLLFFMVLSCSQAHKKEEEINKVKINSAFALFHGALFTASAQDLPTLKTDYPYMFPEGMSDELVLERMKDSTQQFLYKEVCKVYKDFEPKQKEIEYLFSISVKILSAFSAGFNSYIRPPCEAYSYFAVTNSFAVFNATEM